LTFVPVFFSFMHRNDRPMSEELADNQEEDRV